MKKLISFKMLKKNCEHLIDRYYAKDICTDVENKGFKILKNFPTRTKDGLCNSKNCPIWNNLENKQ